MNTILLATKNNSKIKEFKDILKPFNIKIITLNDLNENFEVIENGNSFEENAIIKAKYIAKETSMLTIADDSGIEIEVLDGFPGIYSARFAGEKTSYDFKNKLILSMMRNKDNRKARFVCAMAIALPSGEVEVVKEYIEGEINTSIKGENGFGYDPIFYLKEYDSTFAQISANIKNKISHRYKASQAVINILKELDLI
ncbi:MAG: XTP/dITP diphosphatase [Bacilli bacterium]|nr:XTP/dITP diphosphatase [Bacilli bacterium]